MRPHPFLLLSLVVLDLMPSGPALALTEDPARTAPLAALAAVRRELSDPRPNVRRKAIDRAAEAGKEATLLLRDAFYRETDPGNQVALIETLGRLRDPRSIELLASVAGDSARQQVVRAAAVDAVQNDRSPDVLRARLRLLYDPRTPETLVARALPPLARDRILPLNDLASFLESPSPIIRAAALLSLNVKAALPDETKTAVLARLDDTSPDVRQAAALASAALRLREAIPRLLAIAAEKTPGLHETAVRALCAMPDPRGRALFLEAARSQDASIRRLGERALVMIREDSDVKPADAISRDAPAPIGLDSGAEGTHLLPRRRVVTSEPLKSSEPGPMETRKPDLWSFARRHSGDPRKGEELLREEGRLSCLRCHSLGLKGAKGGADLARVGLRMDKPAIIAAVFNAHQNSAAGSAHSRPVEAAKQPASAASDAAGTNQELNRLSPLEFTDLITYLAEKRPTSKD